MTYNIIMCITIAYDKCCIIISWLCNGKFIFIIFIYFINLGYVTLI